jgi:hypothetical protein
MDNLQKKMTKEQIQRLRELIQAEINYAIQDRVHENPWSYETIKENDKYWEQFAETFNSTPTEPLKIDV